MTGHQKIKWTPLCHTAVHEKLRRSEARLLVYLASCSGNALRASASGAGTNCNGDWGWCWGDTVGGNWCGVGIAPGDEGCILPLVSDGLQGRIAHVNEHLSLQDICPSKFVPQYIKTDRFKNHKAALSELGKRGLGLFHSQEEMMILILWLWISPVSEHTFLGLWLEWIH